MKFNYENMGKYNVFKGEKEEKCIICNNKTDYKDYWCNESFCSSECQSKYYEWLKRNKTEAI